MNRDPGSRRLAVMLAISFALTIACFLVSRIVSDFQARGIREAARTMSQHTIPATEWLSNVRTELRRTDALLDALTEAQTSPAEVEGIRDELERGRSEIHRSWSSYMALPIFPGERELTEATESNMHVMSASVDIAVRRALEGDRHGAAVEVKARTHAAIARTDEEVRATSDLNRRLALEAAQRIELHRRESRTWGFVMDALSALLAMASAYFVIRVVRRFLMLTEQRIAELEQFAGRVAHDIRSPLNTIAFALELARRRPETDPKTRSVLDRGIGTVQRIGQLVDGLLVFAMAGKPPSGEQGAPLQGVLDGIVEDTRPLAEEKEIVLHYERPESEMFVACSPGVLVSMFSNLLSNAIKYMGDAELRRVEVRTRQRGDRLRVEVRDSGPGIPAALAPRVFDLHVRAAESSIPGLGLGLATVRRLAEAHGGTVGNQPNVEGGSLFWFELPLWRRGAPVGTPDRRPRAAARSSSWSLPSPGRP